jgi:hypothetical protein
MLPKQMGCGSGSTCWRRLRAWQEGSVLWKELHPALLDRLGEANRIEWERASLDSASVPAKRGVEKPGRIRRIVANRARSATLFRTEGASRSPQCSPPPTRPRLEAKVLEEAVEAIKPIKRSRGLPGRQRERPGKLHADTRPTTSPAAPSAREEGHKSAHLQRRDGLRREARKAPGWVVELTLAWLARYRRLSARYERRDDIHEAFLHRGCSPICLNDPK